jgi:formate dehydrogenase subunit delta
VSHDQIVKMANDIGHFYGAEPVREDAIAGIANHIRRYWAKRMRDKLVEHARQRDSGLDELPLAAAQRLAAPVSEAATAAAVAATKLEGG